MNSEIVQNYLNPEFVEIMESDPKVRRKFLECRKSTRKFIETFFARTGRFKKKFGPIHDSFFASMDKDSNLESIVLAPRGLGKTTLIEAWVVKRLLMAQSRFAVIFSKSAELAILSTERIKELIQDNEEIHKVFGLQEGARWTKEIFHLKNGAVIFPRGAGQQVRGMLSSEGRPDLFVFDDIEDPKKMDSEEYREETKKWFMADVWPLVELGGTDYRRFMAATMPHPDSLAGLFSVDTDWNPLKLELCGDDLKSNWPDGVSDEWIRKQWERYRKIDSLDLFMQEYRNVPVGVSRKPFRQAMFQYYSESDPEIVKRFRDSATAIIIDPAKSQNAASDPSAIVAVTVDCDKGNVYLREVISGRFPVSDIIGKALDLGVKYKAQVIAPEVSGLNDFITTPFQNEIRARALWFEFVEMKAMAKEKKGRITASIEPLYRAGRVFHNRDHSQIVEAQLLAHPYGSDDHVIDAFSYIAQVQEKAMRFFDPIEIEEDLSQIEKEYEGLENDPPIPEEEFAYA